MSEDTQLQSKNNPAEHLKPWQFKPGVSGNPGGRPKGSVSLKQWAKNMLETMTDEEKREFLMGLDKIDLWRMAEGNPAQDLTSKGEKIQPIPILGGLVYETKINNVRNNDSDKESTSVEVSHSSSAGGDIGQQDNLNIAEPDKPSTVGQETDVSEHSIGIISALETGSDAGLPADNGGA